MAAATRSQSSTAIENLNRGYENLTQLRALLLSSSFPANSRTGASANRLLDKALDCITAALSELQISSASLPAASGEKNKISTDPSKRRRTQQWTIVTSVPHFDGHQWRKYGEKHIHRSKFPRSYYKCAHNKEKGCAATKTIQQKEDEDSNTPKYVVIYSMQHICKTLGTNAPLIKEYSSSIENNSSSTTTPSTLNSYVPPSFNCHATSTQHVPTLIAEQECLIEPMLLSNEPQREENDTGIWFTESPLSIDLDVDWDQLFR